MCDGIGEVNLSAVNFEELMECVAAGRRPATKVYPCPRCRPDDYKAARKTDSP